MLGMMSDQRTVRGDEMGTKDGDGNEAEHDAGVVSNDGTGIAPTGETGGPSDGRPAEESDPDRAEVAEHEKEMMKIGAEVQGEGAIE